MSKQTSTQRSHTHTHIHTLDSVNCTSSLLLTVALIDKRATPNGFLRLGPNARHAIVKFLPRSSKCGPHHVGHRVGPSHVDFRMFFFSLSHTHTTNVML